MSDVIHLCRAYETYEGGRGAPTRTYCDRHAVEYRENQPPYFFMKKEVEGQRVEVYARVGNKLVERASTALDQANRQHPLNTRPLPKEFLTLAKEAGVCVPCFRAAVLDRCWPPAPERMSDDALKAFVREWLSGNVWSNMHVPAVKRLVDMVAGRLEATPQQLIEMRQEAAAQTKMCFILLGVGETAPEDYLAQVGIYWQHIGKCKTVVADMPTFLEHQTMHRADWERAQKAINRTEQALNNIEI